MVWTQEKRQPPATVLFRTTLTRTITLYELIKILLNFILSQRFFLQHIFRVKSAFSDFSIIFWCLFLFLNMSQSNISSPFWQSKTMTGYNGGFHLVPVEAMEYELQWP